MQTHTLAFKENLERTTNLTVMFSGCGRKLEYAERSKMLDIKSGLHNFLNKTCDL